MHADAGPAPKTGGSGAAVRIGPHAVVKVAAAGEAAKLDAEARWLVRITGADVPPRVRRHFPAVLRSPGNGRDELVLQRLPGVDARSAVLSGGASADRALALAGDVVRFAFGDLAALDVRRPGWPTGRWCAEHLRTGLDRARRVHPAVDRVLGAQRVRVAGADLPNPLRDGGRSLGRLLASLRPPRTLLLHGDLHLGNVLVDQRAGDFFLIDPRGGWGGEPTFDPAYDIAKLLHETHYVSVRQELPAMLFTDAGGRVDFAHAPLPVPVAAAERLARLAVAGTSLATTACRVLRREDPELCARATLLTGVLLVTVLRLPHTVGYQWSTLLAHGLAWLAAGEQAVTRGYGLERCTRLWRALTAEAVPDPGPRVLADALQESG